MNHLQLILHFRYLILIPLMILEGPTITFVGALLASQGVFEASDILVLSLVCNEVGDIIHYAAGRWGRISFIRRWGHFIGVTQDRVIAMEKHYVLHGAKTLMLGKLSLAFGSITLLSAGVARYPLWRFILFSALVEFPKTILVFLLGYYFGTAYKSFSHYLVAISVVAILFVLIWWLYRRNRFKGQAG